MMRNQRKTSDIPDSCRWSYKCKSAGTEDQELTYQFQDKWLGDVSFVHGMQFKQFGMGLISIELMDPSATSQPVHSPNKLLSKKIKEPKVFPFTWSLPTVKPNQSARSSSLQSNWLLSQQNMTN